MLRLRMQATLKNLIIVTIMLTLLLTLVSCQPAAPQDNTEDAVSQDSTEDAAPQDDAGDAAAPDDADDPAPQEDEPQEEPPMEESPPQEPLPKRLIYISVMGGRDCSAPIEEKGFDFNNFDIIIQLDPNTSTAKIIDIAWLMGIPVSETETLAMMMMGDRYGPAALPGEMEKAFDLQFTDTIITNFMGHTAFLDDIGGVNVDVSQEVIDDESLSTSVDNLGFMMPGVTPPEKPASAGQQLLNGLQTLAFILTTPARISGTQDMDALIRSLNGYIEGRAPAMFASGRSSLDALSAEDIAAAIKKAQPNMYCSIEESQYSAFAQLLVDIAQVRQKIKDFLSSE